MDLIAKDELQAKLTAATGKSAFPDAIAELVAQHAKEEKPSTVDPEVAALRASLKEKLPRTKVGSSPGVTKEAIEAFLAAEAPSSSIENLLQSRLIAPIPGNATAYQLTDDARARPLKLGEPLNCHIEWYGSAHSAVDVSGDLRARILELYDAYLAPDGKAVDYEGMKGDARFDAYVDATVELTKVDLSHMSREGALCVCFAGRATTRVVSMGCHVGLHALPEWHELRSAKLRARSWAEFACCMTQSPAFL